MSQLPNAPLVEVIFELKWKISGKDELSRVQYLHGDLYSKLKSNFPYRESLISSEIPLDVYINNPSHRFRPSSGEYPVVQVGPGVMTLNTIDDKYFWKEYKKLIIEAIESLFSIYSFNNEKKLTLSLKYLDFLKFDFESGNILKFLDEKLKVTVNQRFYDNSKPLKSINLGFYYDAKPGTYVVNFNRGTVNKEEGIVFRTKITDNDINPNLNQISNWLTHAHNFCHDHFIKMTKGELYESFKK